MGWVGGVDVGLWGVVAVCWEGAGATLIHTVGIDNVELAGPHPLMHVGRCGCLRGLMAMQVAKLGRVALIGWH